MVDPRLVRKWVMSSALAGAVIMAPTLGHAALGDQTLKLGMQHNDVKQLQEVLREKGYFTYGTSTGYFGTITKEAVMKFQRDQHLTVDGIAGKKTFSQLNVVKSSPAQSTPAKPTAPANSSTKSQTTLNTTAPLNANKTLRIGARGSAVTALQKKLAALGLYKTAIDGIYGSGTAQAVKLYQQKNGLTVDGIAGPKTLSSLNAITAKATEATQKTSAAKDTATNNQPAKDNKQPAKKEGVILASREDTAPVLRFGDRGTGVTELQNGLRTLGVFPYTVDGIFGKQTETAVRLFQQQNNLGVDGIVDAKTWDKLKALSAGAVETSKTNGVSQPSSAKFNVIQLVAHASTFLGSPYVWGGITPSGFDCSGFLVYVFNQQGVALPRTVAEQWNAGKKVSQPSVGDVVFFETVSSGPSHNGIYVGNNQFIHSGSSTGVTISDLNASYWQSRYLGARQLY